jgi:hypothetical protein
MRYSPSVSAGCRRATARRPAACTVENMPEGMPFRDTSLIKVVLTERTLPIK